MAKIKTLRACSFCSREVYKLANPGRGLCAACYYREKRNGDLAYRPARTRKTCSIEDCDDLSVAQGLCPKHLKRKVRRGSPVGERYEKWGHVDKHPLAAAYYTMRRSHRHEMHQPWLDDFWTFVADMGDRPSERHKIRRVDKSRPYAPGNVIWYEASISTADAKAYAKADRALNPEKYRNSYLVRNFGLTLEEYAAISDRQGHRCAICGEPEKAIIQGNEMPLAVDHCHIGGQVRGLLCARCNQGIGHLKDDVTILRAAIAYLEKHTLPPTPE